jgi:hypothetical protein
MSTLANIQVFAESVAQIMRQLDSSFPLPCEIARGYLSDLYGPTQVESEPRIIEPEDSDYNVCFPYSFMPETALAYVSGEQFSTDVSAREGRPLAFWTPGQRTELARLRKQVRDAEEIFDATLEFLLREGYVVRVSQASAKEYVLASKGFAHLNKKFEGGTIRDEFQNKTSNRVFQLVKGGGDVATAGKAIVDALSTFLM